MNTTMLPFHAERNCSLTALKDTVGSNPHVAFPSFLIKAYGNSQKAGLPPIAV